MNMKKWISSAMIAAIVLTGLSSAAALTVQPISGDNANNATISTNMPTLSPLPQIGTGTESAFAVDSKGNLWSWGNNERSQLGLGVEGNKISSPTKTEENVRSVAGGKNHTLILTSAGEVKTFGGNEYGQLGHLGKVAAGAPIKVLDDGLMIAAGDNHSLALANDGTLYAWGDNSKGQLGTGSSKANEPRPVKVATGIVEIAAGGNVSMAIKGDGTLYVWGENRHGQVGNGKTSNVTKPTAVMKNVVSFDTGGQHSMATTTDGALYAWGRGNNGQLGNSKKSNVIKPTKIQNTIAGTDGKSIGTAIPKIKKVSTGKNHSVLLSEDGKAYICGVYRFEQAQDSSGKISKYLVSRPKQFAQNIANISSGDEFILLVSEDSKVYSYGMNSAYQLGQSNFYSPSNKTVEVKLGESSSSNNSNSDKDVDQTGTSVKHPIYGEVVVKSEKTLAKTDKSGKSYEITETVYEYEGKDNEGSFTVTETEYYNKEAMKALIPKDEMFIYTMDMMMLSDGTMYGSSRAYYVRDTKFISTIRMSDANMVKAVGTKVDSGEDIHKLLG